MALWIRAFDLSTTESQVSSLPSFLRLGERSERMGEGRSDAKAWGDSDVDLEEACSDGFRIRDSASRNARARRLTMRSFSASPARVSIRSCIRICTFVHTHFSHTRAHTDGQTSPACVSHLEALHSGLGLAR